MAPRLGVVTVTYNSERFLPAFLASLREQDVADSDLRIYVIDNASIDGTRALLGACTADTRVTLNPENRGFAAATNQGIRQALRDGCEFVLLLNNDTTFDAGHFSRMLEAARCAGCQVLTPRIDLNEPWGRSWYAGARLRPWRAFGASLADSECGGPDSAAQRPELTEFAPACCLLVARTIFEEVGLLDEDFFVYCEDVDYCLRLGRRGFPIHYCGWIRMHHARGGSTGGPTSKFSLAQRVHNQVILLRKHGSLPQQVVGLVYLQFWIAAKLILGDGISATWVRQRALFGGLVARLHEAPTLDSVAGQLSPARPGSPDGARRSVLARNAIANLVRGTSSSLLNLVLPLVLVRVFPSEDYAAWILIFGISLYALYLDLGLYSSVSTLVASTHASGEASLSRGVVGAALRMISVVSAGLLVVYVGMALSLKSLFPSVPSRLAAPAAWGMVLLGAAQVVVLYSTVIAGYFGGLQRSEVPARTIAFGKLVVFLATLGVALGGAGIGTTALAYFLATLGYFVVLMRSYRADLHGRATRQDLRRMLGPLAALSGTFGAFSICLLAISGLDTTIVARLSYGDLGPFGVATSMCTLVIGFFGAVLSPLLPEFTRMKAHGREGRVADTLVETGAVVTELLLALLVLFVIAGLTVLRVVAGTQLADVAYPLMLVLVAAAASRTSILPLTMAVVAVRERRAVLLIPASAEAATNLVTSIVLCTQIGAAGVAIGTLVGAWIGIAIMLLVVVPRTAGLAERRREITAHAWIAPAARMAPLLGAGALVYYAVGGSWLRVLAVCAAAIVSGWLVWRSAPEWALRPGQLLRRPLHASPSE